MTLVRVAGVHAPAFVERGACAMEAVSWLGSPGFTPRPSLSAAAAFRHRSPPSGSPGFTPRPSLSDPGTNQYPPASKGSPGFTPRPSLSAYRRRAEPRPPHPGVAGVHAPAFVERVIAGVRNLHAGWVAGVHAPAFVERWNCHPPASEMPIGSPGFTPRPSLSAETASRRPPRVRGGVAGVHAPAFVERDDSLRRVLDAWLTWVAGVHAPAFVERASAAGLPGGVSFTGVAGVHAPAFVERRRTSAGPAGRRSSGVAGVHAPAFVERFRAPRPWRPGPRVAGVHAPAFVERRPSAGRGCR